MYAVLLASDYRDIEFADTDVEERELDIQSLYDSVYAEPLSAEYDPEAHAATESVTGVSFDMDEAKKLWDEAEYGATVEIPLIKTEPEVTTEYLNSILFRDCLSQKSTTLYGSSSNRINNITLADQSLNSVVVNPGESLSYNKALGRRTAEAGYLAAGAYSAGQVVYEIGGGICQGSSTLYYCALLANLQIDNRVCHMFPVAYLPPGMDATVSWPTPDFKFTNNRPYPIRIEAYVNAGELTIKLWGTDTDGSYVEMTYGTWFIYTDAEHPGEATGYKAASYRWVYASDGTVVSKKLEDYSTYYYHKEEEEEPEETPTDPTPPPTDPNAPPTDPNVPTGPTDGTGPGGDGAGEGGTGEGTGTEGAGTDGTGTDGTGTDGTGTGA